jgi:hypothetical protein
MLILLLDVNTMGIWIMLPTFQRNMLPPLEAGWMDVYICVFGSTELEWIRVDAQYRPTGTVCKREVTRQPLSDPQSVLNTISNLCNQVVSHPSMFSLKAVLVNLFCSVLSGMESGGQITIG